MSTSLRSLPGPVWGSPHSLTDGSAGWLPRIIVLQNSYLAGPSIDRAPVGALHPQTNFLTPLSLGLAIQTHGLEWHGRRERDSQSSSLTAERYWCWMSWSRSKTRLVHKKDAYVSLRCR